MGRGVVAGDGVDRQQQAEREHPTARDPGPDIGARRPRIICEGPQARQVVGARAGQADDGQKRGRRKDQVAGEIGELRRERYAVVVDQCLAAAQHGGERHQQPHRIGQPERRTEGAQKEVIDADIDGSEHRDQPQQIEPGRQPARKSIAEYRAPVIQTAGRREGRCDLRHGKSKGSGHDHAQRPAQSQCRPAGPGGRLRQRVYGAGEDADDRKGNREIRESAQAPREFLRVAHVVQHPDVIIERHGGILVRIHRRDPSRKTTC
jgi:hypothetical protein